MKCDRYSKTIEKDNVYYHDGKILYEDCRLHAGLFALGHTGYLKKSFYIKDRKH